ncbi:uncharacterized protein LOC122867070 [Siniperca chuatsi]|uniref:uncharacterized protein LOC122867070 n=1 Tax=Siniperca chuatsi TaxID=119488 RepID=UPI001CE0D69F|nr:uncharacterized protein LOC122867070 [Siniperca chuatsi]
MSNHGVVHHHANLGPYNTHLVLIFLNHMQDALSGKQDELPIYVVVWDNPLCPLTRLSSSVSAFPLCFLAVPCPSCVCVCVCVCVYVSGFWAGFQISRLLLITGTPDHHLHQPPQLSTGLIHTSSARSSSYPTSVLPVITSLSHGHLTLVSVSACLHPISPALNHASQSRTRQPDQLPWSPLNAPPSSLRSNSPYNNALRQTSRCLQIHLHNKTVQT